MLIDVAISGDRNVNKKEAEKILKYKDLTIEIQRMWNVKTKVMPVIIGATGTISKSLRKYMSNITGNHEVKELQKTTILGTADILRKVLMKEYNRFDTETNDIRTMNSNNRIASTLFPRDIVCVRNVSINILHKGDGDDDDNNNNYNYYYLNWIINICGTCRAHGKREMY